MHGSLSEALLEFLESSIHSILYVRGIYPASLFEQRQYLGVSVWQSRHPDINTYIRRVLDNVEPLILQGIVDRVVVATVNQSGKAMDHISIKCSYANPYSSNTVYIDRGAEQIRLTSEPDMSIVYEELRSCILRIGLLDSQLPKLPEDCTWSAMVVTNDNHNNEQGDSLLQATLSSGEWYVDNNQLSEELSFAQRSCSGHHSSGGDVRSGSSGSSGGETVSPALPAGTPKLVPIKSFRNELVNMSIYAHVFS